MAESQVQNAPKLPSNPPSKDPSKSFPYTSAMVQLHFGKEQKVFMIHSALVTEDFFASLPYIPVYYQPKCNMDQIKTGLFPHITSDAGQTLVHFLYTGEYKVQDEVNKFDNAPERENLFTHTISNLFAAEICNLSKLQDLVRLEIEKIAPSLNIFRSLKLVDAALNSDEMRDRAKDTAKSREWLTAHLKKQLKYSFNIDDKIFVGVNLFDFIKNTSLLEGMETEIIKIMYEQIVAVQNKLIESRERERNTKRMFDEVMAEKETAVKKIKVIERRLMNENEIKTPRAEDEQLDIPTNSKITPKRSLRRRTQTQIMDCEYDVKSEAMLTSEDSDDDYDGNV